jgi:hypothetical protein
MAIADLGGDSLLASSWKMLIYIYLCVLIAIIIKKNI